MKAIIHIGLKAGVLDVQGKAVAGKLAAMGFTGVADARVGKVIELDLKATDADAAAAEVKAMCDQLLANPVIESYRIELTA
jgi:phosphoribosylformylglycinamidine synthase